MTEPNWRKPKEPNTFQIKAKPEDGLWTKVLDFVAGPRKLRFTASGDWTYASGKDCNPGGTRTVALSAFIPSTPVGALICKIGGSSADGPPVSSATAMTTPSPVAAPLIFTVGNFCTIEIADGTKGALFATMNDQLGAFDQHDKEITLVVEEAL